MNPEIWARSSNNTNAAEAAHALANREGKQLKLLTAIIKLVFLIKIYLIYLVIINYVNYFLINIFRGKKIDQKALKIMETKNKFGVPYSRRDNGEIKRNAKAITRKGI